MSTAAWASARAPTSLRRATEPPGSASSQAHLRLIDLADGNTPRLGLSTCSGASLPAAIRRVVQGEQPSLSGRGRS